MNEINAIAICGTKPLDIEHYFRINFEELNNSINKLGDRSKELTNDDKILAVEIIETWNKNVIDALDKKIHEVREFCDSFDLTYETIRLTDEEIGSIAAHLGMDKEFEDYEDSWNTYLSLQKEAKHIDMKFADVKKIPENKDLLGQYSAEKYNVSVEITKARNKCDKVTTDLFTKMAKTKEIKDFIKKGLEFLSQADELKKAAVNKANLARVNVTIDNANVRDALFELMAFSI